MPILSWTIERGFFNSRSQVELSQHSMLWNKCVKILCICGDFFHAITKVIYKWLFYFKEIWAGLSRTNLFRQLKIFKFTLAKRQVLETEMIDVCLTLLNSAWIGSGQMMIPQPSQWHKASMFKSNTTFKRQPVFRTYCIHAKYYYVGNRSNPWEIILICSH